MAIENPLTYAEWFWSNSVEARMLEQENYEKELSPITSGVISGLNIMEYLPTSLSGLFEAMQAPTVPALAGVLARFGSEVADGVVNQTLNHALKDFNYKMAEWFSDLRIDFPTASILLQRKKITDEMFESRAKSSGYKPAESAAAYDALRPFPTIPEIIDYARYHGDYDNIKGTVWEKYDVDVDDFNLWEWLGLQKLTTEQAQRLFVREKLSEPDFRAELGRIGWHFVDRDSIRDLAYQIPNAMLLVQAGLLQEISTDEIIKDIQIADIHPDYAQKYYDAILTKPASIDVIAYELRKDPELTNLPDELHKIGIHPNYHQLYKELAYQIPPVQDIITMAVREAFTPDIAQRFGQYEGLPLEYVDWAGKKGLTKEWAERYWAAHWSLPSVQQGFEMLHRGIITPDELQLLLRALDVMPFWRNKLVEMSYRPLTRVDVRRMFRVGTLDESGIKKAYRDVGYSDTNADLMADFTIRHTRQALSAFSSRDVISAYIKRFIDEGNATQLLRDIGVRPEEIQNIITTANYKRQWAFKTERTDAIENLYKKGRIDETQARRELEDLGLPADHIHTLLQQWIARVEDVKVPTWTTAQTLAFLKKQLITPDRAVAELRLLGYNDERISVYLASAKPPP